MKKEFYLLVTSACLFDHNLLCSPFEGTIITALISFTDTAGTTKYIDHRIIIFKFHLE